MMLDSTVERNIDACYDALFQPAGWSDALHGLARSLNSACMMFYPRNPAAAASDPRNPTRDIMQMPISRDYGDLLSEYIKNSWYLGHYRAERGFPLLEAGRLVVTEHDLATDEERRRLRHYNELYLPFGFPGFAMVGLKIHGELWAVPLLKGKGQGHFTRDDALALTQIAPHFRRLISLSETLTLTEARTSLATLDALSCASFLLDTVGNVLSYNRLAEQLLGDGLMLSGRRLRASDHASDFELGALLHQVATVRSAAKLAGIRPAVVRRETGRPLLVEALPTAGILGDVFQSTSAFVIVKKLDDKPLSDIDLLQRGYGLTPAEARVAALLASGVGPNSIAERLHLSRETVRGHIKTIFAKTDTHRQSEFVAQAARFTQRTC